MIEMILKSLKNQNKVDKSALSKMKFLYYNKNSMKSMIINENYKHIWSVIKKLDIKNQFYLLVEVYQKKVLIYFDDKSRLSCVFVQDYLNEQEQN